jgi:hypothetical protein
MKSILSITALFLSLSINVFSQVVNCSRCNGTGKETKQSAYECQNCKSWNSEYRRKVPCNVCLDTRVNPNRKTWKETCSSCKGTGRNYAQEARNREFGGRDFRVVNGAYSGQISNMEFKSLSIEFREAYKAGLFGNGIKTEFEYKEWSTVCSCMGSNWRLTTKDELESISGYLKVNGELNVTGIGYYGSSTETTVNGSPRVWVQYLNHDFVNSPIRETPGSFNIKTAKIFCVRGNNVNNNIQSQTITTNSNVSNNINNQSQTSSYGTERKWIHSNGNLTRTINKNNLGEIIWLEDSGRFTYYETSYNSTSDSYIIYRKGEAHVKLEIYNTHVIYKDNNNQSGTRIFNGQWQR